MCGTEDRYIDRRMDNSLRQGTLQKTMAIIEKHRPVGHFIITKRIEGTIEIRTEQHYDGQRRDIKRKKKRLKLQYFVRIMYYNDSTTCFQDFRKSDGKKQDIKY